MYIYHQTLRFLAALSTLVNPKIVYERDKDGKTTDIKIKYQTSKQNKEGEIIEIPAIKGIVIEVAPFLGAISLLFVIVWQIHGVYWQLYSILGAYYFFSFDMWFEKLDEAKLKYYWSKITERKETE